MLLLPRYNVRHRLTTRDRMHRWGVAVPSYCILRGSSDEIHQHLFFFECDFSSSVRSFFLTKVHLSPPFLFHDCVRWMKHPTSDNNINVIIRLWHQAAVYGVSEKMKLGLGVRVPLAFTSGFSDFGSLL